MKLSRHSVVAVVVGLGVAASLVLSGCSLGGPSSGGTDGSGGSGGSSSGSDGSTTTTESSTDGGLDDFVGMPDTFPADIPVVDGEVLFGIDLGTGWSIVVKADDIVAGYANASSKLIDAGYTSDVSSTSADGSFGSFSNATYTVQVTATDSSDYGTSVQYVVVKNG